MTTAPNNIVVPESVVTYQLVAHNRGLVNAEQVEIILPFSSELQALLEASFSIPRAWVSAVEPDAVKIRLERLDRGETFVATLHVRTNRVVPLGSVLASRASVEWGNRIRPGVSYSNRVSVVIAHTMANSPTVPLSITPASGAPATGFAATYDGFASYERVSLWNHQPDGQVIGLGDTQADGEGRITYSLAAAALHTGQHMLVAHGLCSQVSAVGKFAVTEP